MVNNIKTILKERRTGTAYTIHGECCMLSKYGEIYDCINNLYHPNPGVEADHYSEIELCVDWLIRNNLGNQKVINKWIDIRVARYLDEVLLSDGEIDNQEAIEAVFLTDIEYLCEKSKRLVVDALEKIDNDADYFEELLDEDDIDYARKMTIYINNTFTRVRAGGKLDSYGSDEIYFRISSKGYNWNRTITDFLWDVFGDIKSMPSRIWIGHDLETNPPEIVLFDGTPEDLFSKYDGKVMEEIRRSKRFNVNKDREAVRLNVLYKRVDQREFK